MSEIDKRARRTSDTETRLRKYASGDLIAADGFVAGDVVATLREAADELAALKAKLARAKEALAEIVIPPQAEGSSLYYIETEDMQRATVVLAELESP